jgi:hypothetical protein
VSVIGEIDRVRHCAQKCAESAAVSYSSWLFPSLRALLKPKREPGERSPAGPRFMTVGAALASASLGGDGTQIAGDGEALPLP